ncbi:MAG TPA: ATP-binding protein [Ramlibacter sp.]|jgi:PAS domain S-box-containing protein|uniref:ATP-binding protein n=1 Tax=Ramlibacter sp. TaxID=1917967 RepID=UPI002D5A6D63|nr:ATP-binding protein [Ramlibacter sp.]HZY19222.1 ATP-binding protein [Ramlibacter sp.]
MGTGSLQQDIEAVASIDAVPLILEVLTRTTGMGFAAVARVTDQQWICCAVRDEIAFGLGVGGELQLQTTICNEIRQSGEAVVIDDVAADPHFRTHHTPAMYGFRSYISVPIYRRDGEFFGTLCAIDPAPARLTGQPSVAMFRAFADLIGQQLDAQDKAAELHRVREESEQRKRLYETILSNTPDLAYVFDLEHRFVYANQVLLQMWGRTWDEAIGRTCRELGYPEWHAAMHDREIEEVKATGRSVRGQVPFEGAFGPRVYDYILVPVLDAQGRVEAVAGTTRDVTDFKQDEQRLAGDLGREQRRADLMARVATVSQQLNRTLSVDALARLLTDEARELIGAHQSVTSLTVGGDWSQAINAVSLSPKYDRWRDYVGAPDGTGIYAEVCRTNTAARMTQAELEAHPAWRGFGPHAAEHPPMNGWLAVPLVGHSGTNLGLVQLSDKVDGEFTASDEAVLKQLAAVAAVSIENAQLYERLREQDRRKDEFLAVLAHELRNPLAPIRTGIGLLQRTPSPDTSARTLQMMERQLGHMVRLIDDLMDISRISTGKIQLQKHRFDLRSAVNAAVESCRPALEIARHELQLVLPDEELPVEGDATRLAQVVGNLLSNAIKYTPAGGRIEVQLCRRDGQAELRVQDNGAGMEAAILPSVFEMFVQEDRSRANAQGGLGIGLALVRQLLEMHGGRIAATSPGLGHGSTFTLTLPLAAGHPAAVQAATADPAPGLPEQGLRILVVDDNVDAADTLAILLEAQGHEARVAVSGEQALEVTHAFTPDCVLLDIGLPGMNGYDVARRLRTSPDPRLAACKLVALTGWGSHDDRDRAAQAGFDVHLTKPVDVQRLDTLLTDLARTGGSATSGRGGASGSAAGH